VSRRRDGVADPVACISMVAVEGGSGNLTLVKRPSPAAASGTAGRQSRRRDAQLPAASSFSAMFGELRRHQRSTLFTSTTVRIASLRVRRSWASIVRASWIACAC